MDNKILLECLKHVRFSAHFTAYEMVASGTADSHGISNLPSQDYIFANLRLVCEFLEEFRNRVGHPLVINSGYRNEHVNKLVHGVSNSLHMEGLAADIAMGRLPSHIYVVAYGIAKRAFEETHGSISVGYEIHPSRGYIHIQLKKKKK